MSDIELLRKIADDVAVLKDKVEKIEVFMDELDQDLHRELNPEYLKKLENIEKEDERVRFRTMEEFDKYFEES